ncbi:MAG: PucR family transcriptional regulator [Pseudomonadota bacterium]
MTQIITRYFPSIDRARAARKDMLFIKRFPPAIIHLYETTEGTADALDEYSVDPATRDAYLSRMASGGAVLLVRAGFRPLDVAQSTRDTMAELGAADMGDLIEEVKIKESHRHASSIDPDHALIMSNRRDPDPTNNFMANWPLPLISRRKPYTYALIEPHARMADVFWPLIIEGKPYTFSLFDDHQRMANFPIPLISKRKPFDGFAFPRHSRMANMFLPLISKRKPYTGSAIEPHARMANWPFPHLITSPPGNNSLMPGAPRMANFPIPLLSGRKPYDAFAFARHARMANFPISLISKRKPFTGSMFPRHARMANFILPLLTRSSFTLSGLFGFKTLSTR